MALQSQGWDFQDGGTRLHTLVDFVKLPHPRELVLRQFFNHSSSTGKEILSNLPGCPPPWGLTLTSPLGTTGAHHLGAYSILRTGLDWTSKTRTCKPPKNVSFINTITCYLKNLSIERSIKTPNINIYNTNTSANKIHNLI